MKICLIWIYLFSNEEGYYCLVLLCIILVMLEEGYLQCLGIRSNKVVGKDCLGYCYRIMYCVCEEFCFFRGFNMGSRRILLECIFRNEEWQLVEWCFFIYVDQENQIGQYCVLVFYRMIR